MNITAIFCQTSYAVNMILESSRTKLGGYVLHIYSLFAPRIKDNYSQAPNISQEQEEGQKVVTVLEQAQNVLIESKAVFPFDLFPDSITIDRQKMTVIHRQFFGIRQSVSVSLSDIKNIQANLGPIFGSITVTAENFVNNTQTVNFLPKKDVAEIQKVIQGFIVAHKENLDTTGMDDETLLQVLDSLGRGDSSDKAKLINQNSA